MTHISMILKVNSLLVMGIFFLAVASPLHAQWSAGGFFNINSSTFSVNPEPSSEEYSSRFGFGIGGVIDRPLTGQLSLHAKGWKY